MPGPTCARPADDRAPRFPPGPGASRLSTVRARPGGGCLELFETRRPPPWPISSTWFPRSFMTAPSSTPGRPRGNRRRPEHKTTDPRTTAPALPATRSRMNSGPGSPAAFPRVAQSWSTPPHTAGCHSSSLFTPQPRERPLHRLRGSSRGRRRGQDHPRRTTRGFVSRVRLSRRRAGLRLILRKRGPRVQGDPGRP